MSKLPRAEIAAENISALSLDPVFFETSFPSLLSLDAFLVFEEGSLVAGKACLGTPCCLEGCLLGEEDVRVVSGVVVVEVVVAVVEGGRGCLTAEKGWEAVISCRRALNSELFCSSACCLAMTLGTALLGKENDFSVRVGLTQAVNQSIHFFLSSGAVSESIAASFK